MLVGALGRGGKGIYTLDVTTPGSFAASNVKWDRLESMEGVLEVGEEVKVKLIEVDKKTGKFRLSRKVLLPRPPKKETTAAE